MNSSKTATGFGMKLILLTGLIGGCVSPVINEIPPTSSYACQARQVRGSPTAGQGEYGCHFQLRHPETDKVLANTPYHLDVYPPAEGDKEPRPSATLVGVTDAQGRSGFIRSPFPITPERVRFVEMMGSGPHGVSPRLVSAVDGKSIPASKYYVTWCGGAPYNGVTDERGNGVMFSSPTKTCQIKVVFYRRK
jgi:hypothetical protein